MTVGSPVHAAIQRCCQHVDIELDKLHGYTENNYQTALIHFLQRDTALGGFNVHREVHIPYRLSDGYIFGHGRSDIILESDTNSLFLN